MYMYVFVRVCAKMAIVGIRRHVSRRSEGGPWEAAQVKFLKSQLYSTFT